MKRNSDNVGVGMVGLLSPRLFFYGGDDMPVLYSSGGASASMELALPPNPATNLLARGGNNRASITWTDPEDRQEGSKSIWDHSVLIRKQGSAPTSVLDGTKVLESSVRNQYSENTYVDTKVSNGTEYFYAVYTYSTEGVISKTAPIVSVIPRKGKVMTVKIDLNDSNPTTCGSYADDASDMLDGKTADAITAWQEFFGYRPCLFKEGKVVDYLDPNKYTLFENGETADIKSGDAGDVMIEFPRRGIKITKVEKVITVSMTDDPDDPEFTYYAHSRGTNIRDYFYLGAYLGYLDLDSDKLRSLSGKTLTGGHSRIEDFRQYSHNNGNGYEQMTWWQLIYIQVMYLLQFKGKLNSQSTVGTGYCDRTRKTGTGNTRGLIYGAKSDTAYIKLFGLEDLWGAFYTMLDGLGVDFNGYIYTSTDAFNNAHSGYTKQGSASNLDGYIDDVSANTETGFMPISNMGSATTYFCDYVHTGTDAPCMFGYPNRVYTDELGIFALSYDKMYSVSDSYFYSRLSYY